VAQTRKGKTFSTLVSLGISRKLKGTDEIPRRFLHFSQYMWGDPHSTGSDRMEGFEAGNSALAKKTNEIWNTVQCDLALTLGLPLKDEGPKEKEYTIYTTRISRGKQSTRGSRGVITVKLPGSHFHTGKKKFQPRNAGTCVRGVTTRTGGGGGTAGGGLMEPANAAGL